MQILKLALAAAALALLSFAPPASAQQKFAANGGPTIKGALKNLTGYTIDVTFSLDSVGGYQKIIDFKGKTVDPGIYDNDGQLMFYGQATTDNVVIKPDTMVHLQIKRDPDTGVFTASVDGAKAFEFKDDSGDAVFTANTINFFQDDNHTDGRESGPGRLQSISVDGAQVYPAPAKAPEASKEKIVP